MLARYRHGLSRRSRRRRPHLSRWSKDHADCFERTCRPGHITGAAWILSADRRRCLLTHHRKLDRWLQLGGHADGQWHVEEVALREAREESGLTRFDFVPIDGVLMPLDVDVHQIPARYDSTANWSKTPTSTTTSASCSIAHAGQEIRCSDESHEIGWFTPDEVLRLTDEESVLRMLNKTLDLF